MLGVLKVTVRIFWYSEKLRGNLGIPKNSEENLAKFRGNYGRESCANVYSMRCCDRTSLLGFWFQNLKTWKISSPEAVALR